MIIKLLAPLLLITSPFIFLDSHSFQDSGEVLASTDYVPLVQTVQTQTRFSEELESATNPISFETEYVDDDESEYGTEELTQAGVDGVRTDFYRVTYWKEEEIYRVWDHVEIQDPVPEIISRGTKIIWRNLKTDGDGELKYWAKLTNVWATSYDGNCLGCIGITYTGTKVVHGVCATDPAVIPMGTRFYVPGYGLCRAEDIGGAIKGTDVDLGFEDVKYGWWSARYTDVYLLDNAPDD